MNRANARWQVPAKAAGIWGTALGVPVFNVLRSCTPLAQFLFTAPPALWGRFDLCADYRRYLCGGLRARMGRMGIFRSGKISGNTAGKMPDVFARLTPEPG